MVAGAWVAPRLGADAVDSGRTATAARVHPDPATVHTRPRLHVSGPAGVAQQAASQVQPERPVSVTLSNGVVMHVDVASTGADGVLQLPENISRAGWWEGSSRLGDPYGSTVLAAHVDSFTQGIGPFAALLSAHPGERVLVMGPHLAQPFRVVSARFVPKTSLTPGSHAYSAYGRRRLVMITCGGPYDPGNGGYQDNVVVVATPLHAARAR